MVGLIVHFFEVGLECTHVVLLSGCRRLTLEGPLRSDEVLEAVGDPDIEEADTTDGSEPIERSRNVPGPVVPVHAKKHAHHDASPDSLEGVLKPKDILYLESIILHICFFLVVIEKVV